MSSSSGILDILSILLIWTILLGLPILLGFFSFRSFRRSRRTLGAVYLSALVIYLTPIIIFIYLVSPGGDGILDRTTMSGGTELVLVQTYGEFYSVKLYVKRPNRPWDWYVLGLEELRGLKGSIKLDMDGIAQIRKNGSVVAMYDPATESLSIPGESGDHPWLFKTMPDDWTPEAELAKYN